VEVLTHIAQDHPKSIDHFAMPESIDLLPHKIDNDCPLCAKKIIYSRDLEKHLGNHQEELAFFALPSISDRNPIHSTGATVDSSGTRGSTRDSVSMASSGKVPVTVENMTENLALMSLTQENVDMISRWSQHMVVSERSEEGVDEMGEEIMMNFFR
jgi:hypothetical protein